MTPARRLILCLFAALALPACAQNAGDVCQRYGTAGASDCATGLECCGEARTCSGVRGRGLCVQAGTCPETTPLICDDGGMLDEAGVDAGSDSGADAGDDAGSDSGASDAGVDAGSSDAGSSDAGFDAATPDAGTDSGPPDAG